MKVGFGYQVESQCKKEDKGEKRFNDKVQKVKVSEESKRYKQKRQANIKPVKNNKIDISYNSKSEDHDTGVSGNRSYRATLLEGRKTMIFPQASQNEST